MDIEADAPTEELGDNALKSLVSLAEDAEAEEENIARLEAELKAAKARYAVITERQLPELMEDLGLEDFTLKTGEQLKVKEKISAKPAAAKRETLYDHLEETGNGGLIKRTAEFSFGREENDVAKKFVEEAGRPGKFVRKVEPATLSSFVRAQLENGVEIDLELFGVYRQRVVEIKRNS